MQVQQISSLLAVLGLILWTANIAQACDEYTVSNQNLETVITNINNCYLEDLQSGVGKDSMANFLQSLMPNGASSSTCQFPKARLEETTATNLYFIWPKISGATSYGMSCLNFATGETGSQQVGQNQLKTNIVNSAVCLYAFYSLCSQTGKSIVKIIIVDKDIVGDSLSNTDIVPRLGVPNALEKNSVQLGPNPFDQTLRLELALAKEAPVRFYLIGGLVARAQRRLLLETVQGAGNHEWQLELPALVPGYYYGLLEVGAERQIIPLVKVGQASP